jgi:hypothetical protein
MTKQQNLISKRANGRVLPQKDGKGEEATKSARETVGFPATQDRAEPGVEHTFSDSQKSLGLCQDNSQKAEAV